MLRSVLMTALSLIIGYGILVLLIDGIFQDSFPRAVIQFLQSMGWIIREPMRFMESSLWTTRICLWRWALSYYF